MRNVYQSIFKHIKNKLTCNNVVKKTATASIRTITVFKQTLNDMKTQEEKEERKKFLMNRVDKLDNCIHVLEATANNYYSPDEKGFRGWNLLLGSRDEIIKLRDKDWAEHYKLEH